MNSIIRKDNLKIIINGNNKKCIKRVEKNIFDKYKYLKSKNFLNIMDYQYVNGYEIRDYLEDISLNKEEKISELLYLVTMLHIKTTHYKSLTISDIKKFYESETDEQSNEKTSNKIKKNLIIYNNINFTIHSSYYNLNQLTKGKIINDENYKIDIKQLIEKYINTKKKFFLKLFQEYINFQTNNKFNKEDTLIKNYTKNEINITPHNEEISQVYKSIITEKVKINQPRRSKTKTNNKTMFNKLISNKIKKNKTNNKDIYRNYKNINNNGKSSHLIVNNNYFKSGLKTINYGIEDDNQKNDEDSYNTLGKMINKIFFLLKNK